MPKPHGGLYLLKGPHWPVMASVAIGIKLNYLLLVFGI